MTIKIFGTLSGMLQLNIPDKNNDPRTVAYEKLTNYHRFFLNL